MRQLTNETKKFPGHGFSCLRVLLMLALFMVSLQGFSQNITVKGTVTDAKTGETMVGLNVVIKGTVRGVITEVDGTYTIPNCPADAVLVFSYVGYDPLEVAVNGRTTVDAAISPTSSLLDEVVVIGYGTVSRKDVTGSVSSVKGADLASIPVSTAAEALTGKMPGVQVVTTEGSPDAEVTIRVRGGGSITQDNSPLYIVDGFPVSSISDIPSSEIQSVDVLKDASSTAIYGARGANGVIIITTKRGVAGEVKVNYNAYYGFKKVADHLNSIGIEDYMRWQYEYALLADKVEGYEKFFGQYQDIDLYNGQKTINWYDQVFGHVGKTFNQDLSISGGSEKIRYSVGYAGLRSDEIMTSSRYSRDNVSLKLDHKPNAKVDLSFSFRYSDTKIYGAGATDQGGATPNDARVRFAMLYVPIPFKGMMDYEDEEMSTTIINPLDNVRDNDRQQFRKRFNLGGSFSWKILDDLVFKTEAGLDYYNTNDDRYFGLTTYYVKNTPSVDYQNQPAVESTESISTSIRNTNTLNYDFKKLLNNENHSLRLLIGQEILMTESNAKFNQVWGFPTSFLSEDAFRLTGLGYSNDYRNTLNPDNKLLSFFGRINYDIKDRYLFTATFRADGSSKFAKGNRWGYFPSAALAWKVSEEEFMKGISFLDLLKLRVSYGTAGNNLIPSSLIKQAYSPYTTSWINGFTDFWAPSTVMANPDLKWETTYTRNVGLDFAIFKSRVYGNVELYYNTTEDLLIEFVISGTGYNTQYRNMGSTENKGLELGLNAVIVDKKNFGLTAGFNIGFNKNKITSLGIMDDYGIASSWASTEIDKDYRVEKGRSVGAMYGYQNLGRYEVSDFSGYDEANDKWILNDGVATDADLITTVRPGSIKLKDNTDDGKVTVADCKVIGDANPKHTGGFNLQARFFDFDMAAAFSWSYGNEVYNANKIEFTTARYQYQNMTDIMAEGKRWTNLNPSTGEIVNDPVLLEEMNKNTTMWSPYMSRRIFSDWAVEDGSYLRLNTLSLGYNVPSQIINKVKIQKMKIYVSAYNLFILSNYSGFDPEVSARRNTPLTPALDYSAYPKSRQILFGLNLTF